MGGGVLTAIGRPNVYVEEHDVASLVPRWGAGGGVSMAWRWGYINGSVRHTSNLR